MRKAIVAALALLLTGQAAPPAGVGDLAWMSGHWESVHGGRWTEESWSAPRGGVMLGYSRSGSGEAMREFEFLRLQAGADGMPVYVAQPGGGPPVPFRLTARGRTSAIFENPAHDFPQRIVYRRGGDSMVATISALDGSNAMSWTYRRR
ncbi:MAG TPA: DUF6265 family protein [Allosphingosinicella sp.]|nr:DUF6265 family protein [Allosphingosinicella sp.]